MIFENDKIVKTKQLLEGASEYILSQSRSGSHMLHSIQKIHYCDEPLVRTCNNEHNTEYGVMCHIDHLIETNTLQYVKDQKITVLQRKNQFERLVSLTIANLDKHFHTTCISGHELINASLSVKIKPEEANWFFLNNDINQQICEKYLENFSNVRKLYYEDIKDEKYNTYKKELRKMNVACENYEELKIYFIDTIYSVYFIE